MEDGASGDSFANGTSSPWSALPAFPSAPAFPPELPRNKLASVPWFYLLRQNNAIDFLMGFPVGLRPWRKLDVSVFSEVAPSREFAADKGSTVWKVFSGLQSGAHWQLPTRGLTTFRCFLLRVGFVASGCSHGLCLKRFPEGAVLGPHSGPPWEPVLGRLPGTLELGGRKLWGLEKQHLTQVDSLLGTFPTGTVKSPAG